ncbi:AAA family ATPase [uncultured Bacteroides sp.]|uniref:AAA family ATPase n=1 Tax=uncultured Bacteroides sp. TaxID=162156 RepID=UPI002621C89F|nr:AAA family ATPase [uncultured Bacteroides sp.]
MENKKSTEAKGDTIMNKEDFAALWKSIRLKVTDTYDVPPEILWVNGSTIGTLGNFSASTGKAKSKKTFNISAIVAAALTNDEVLHYSCLPPDKRKILYVDTEQSRYHCHKVMERILRLAGLPTDQDRDDFVFIVLREQTPDMRKRIIEYMLENMPEVGLLIIDGIRDLMYDINSPSESTDLINLLMRWSHIHTVLHLNKGDDNTRGHIGTELNNKAETVLQITKSTQDGNISEVKAMHIRDRDFEPFAFRINDSALPEVVDGYVFQQPKQEKSFPLTELTEQQHRTALENGFGKHTVQGYSNVIQALKQGYASIGYERGRNVLVALNTFLVNKRMIVKEGKGYRYNPDFHY